MPNKYFYIKNVIFNNIKMMNKLHLLFFFNIISLIFLTWISHRGNEVGNLNKYIKSKDNIGNTWKLRNDRLLTHNDSKSEIRQGGLKVNLKEPGAKNKLKDIKGYSEIHEKIKRNTSNSMYTYIKKLEQGYTNKKGLKRLDNYYEKKLFGGMYKLDKIAEHMKSKTIYLKKLIWKRYVLVFFIFSLVISFGILMTALCCFIGTSGSCYVKPTDTNASTNNCKDIGTWLLVTNGIVYIPFIITFITYAIYILCKVRKYKRLKKRQVNIREV